MSLGNAQTRITRPAKADLRGKQYHLVTLGGVVAGAAAPLAFPLDNDEAAVEREPAALCVAGVSPVVYGGNVAENDALASDSSGRAVKAVAGNPILGYAVMAGAVNEIGSMLVVLNGKL